VNAALALPRTSVPDSPCRFDELDELEDDVDDTPADPAAEEPDDEPPHPANSRLAAAIAGRIRVNMAQFLTSGQDPGTQPAATRAG